ncbi:HSP chaperone complex subunit [Schizosaccharomyces cryophilus OY26]|uniref:HSP chaperone complex subunit n=1 Tax=Schizosaccharomyces cryophilus (strain OY26 / ATCC MYA-4695 / CBS 11777 / NBRC 106824 / NRRL Y48691) TaxID=653667 RepID=S9X6Q0_SCHCR|nr:HSP chaperone complex subunit [Schizosaccharomyces cryophilus OY26]EPY52767.1 HSP chaperone complex subunit [Schizosaccharomyces cryophilus OY26]
MPESRNSEFDPNTKNKNADEMYNELNKIPFFMQSLDDVEEEGQGNAQLDALKALAYEGPPHEIAQNFREHGNECFATKQYREAAEYYTKALAEKCGKPEIEIPCFSNRAACNLIFENYRQVLNDCTQVLQRDPQHTKALFRSAKALVALKRYDEAELCLRLFSTSQQGDPAVQALGKDLKRKRETFEKFESEKRRIAEEKVTAARVVIEAMKERRIHTKTSEYPPDLGDARITMSTFNDPKSEMYLPTLLLYPLTLQSDFLPSVSENTTPQELLETVFSEQPSWDSENLYRPDSLDVFAATSTGGLVKVGKRVPILQALIHPKTVLTDGLVQFHVVPNSQTSAFITSWKQNKSS